MGRLETAPVPRSGFSRVAPLIVGGVTMIPILQIQGILAVATFCVCAVLAVQAIRARKAPVCVKREGAEGR